MLFLPVLFYFLVLKLLNLLLLYALKTVFPSFIMRLASLKKHNPFNLWKANSRD